MADSGCPSDPNPKRAVDVRLIRRCSPDGRLNFQWHPVVDIDSQGRRRAVDGIGMRSFPHELPAHALPLPRDLPVRTGVADRQSHRGTGASAPAGTAPGEEQRGAARCLRPLRRRRGGPSASSGFLVTAARASGRSRRKCSEAHRRLDARRGQARLSRLLRTRSSKASRLCRSASVKPWIAVSMSWLRWLIIDFWRRRARSVSVKRTRRRSFSSVSA